MAGIDELANAAPWRTFRWNRGQKHYSGTYWSSTVGRHIIYESRLELARLLFADFDIRVRQIVAQPFLLRASVDRKPRKHIPDYLLTTDTGPVVVDVKPARRLADPKVAFTFEWTRELVEARGWRYEVATEPNAVELENVRFLAGYRRSWLFCPELLAQVREKNLDGSPLADAFNCLPGEPINHVKSAVLHLLWRQELLIDLSERLSGRTELRMST
ncbi:TnsA-like heteromeric transposase endonuclease subunit [Mycolicibacterium gilvum]|uniref:TnsA-like heteromeric transposase endonuclease subunit n=1 Tax=Mycolicibacterium gilvum TaxID=1804 RepID=UPI0040459941